MEGSSAFFSCLLSFIKEQILDVYVYDNFCFPPNHVLFYKAELENGKY